MLKTLDILIGISLVMLLVSMIVTVITQFIINLRNLRGQHLLTGLADLLGQIHPGMPRDAAEKISAAVLSHPLVRNVDGKLGNVIHREELTKLLLELGAGDGPQKLPDDLRQHLLDALAANGFAHPDQIKQTLDNVRAYALQLELAHPELSNAARARIAVLQQANSQLIGKINLWFDTTMDRVSERFTANTRMVTFGVGLAVALSLQLDTAALVTRLSVDPQARQYLVDLADKQANAAPPANGSVTALSPEDKTMVRDLMLNNLLGIPESVGDWAGRWSWKTGPMKALGILLTAVLLSLGAPFWYNALQNLVRLRSVIASKDDQQRQGRQLAPASSGASAQAASSPPDSVSTADERGDLAAVA